MIKFSTIKPVGQVLFACLFFLSLSPAKALSPDDIKTDPPNWFEGIPTDTFQLLLKAPSIGEYEVAKPNCGQGSVQKVDLPNKDYLLLHILPFQASFTQGVLDIQLKNGREKISIQYEVKAKESGRRGGVNQADLIYLIMPDRFANYNPENDVIPGKRTQKVDRSDPFARHGGDIRGIIERLDYLFDLGVSALWLNPVYDNDEENEPYHGYAVSDHYNVDPRLGGLEAYADLCKNVHGLGMKIIKDVVYNHCGSGHYLYKSQPSPDWFNQWDGFQKTSYRATTLLDPYASEHDKKVFSDGWFAREMPDFNQRNPHVARYLIQNTLWWVSNFALDGLRIDTYSYSDQDFMNRLCKEVKANFPTIHIFGETWVHGPAIQGYFTEQSKLGGKSKLEAVTDFQLYYALNNAFTQHFGWTDGVSSVYYCMANDYLYKNPETHVTFLDNHDLARFYGTVNGDLKKYKGGIGMLLTMRGIPQLLYGTEILMSQTKNHGLIREDFPGGWEEDSVDKFDPANRTKLENEALSYVQKLIAYRRNKREFFLNASFTHFVPQDGVYVYFRHTEERCLMVMVNCSDKEQKLDFSQYNEFLKGIPGGKSIIDNEQLDFGSSSNLEAWGIEIVEFER